MRRSSLQLDLPDQLREISTFDRNACVERLGWDRLEITICPDRLSKAFGFPVKDLDTDQMNFQAPFTLRRRGVETKLLLDGDAIPQDETMLRNIARGHAFLDRVTSGQSVHRIAGENDLSVRRVQQTLEFAFLAPDVVRQVAAGRQPTFLTADWCLKSEINVDWAEQARQFSAP